MAYTVLIIPILTAWSMNFSHKNAKPSDIEAPFLDLHLTISYGFVSSKIYDKHDDFDLIL